MAQLVITKDLCDRHLNLKGGGEHVEGDTEEITINGKAYATELCPECRAKLLNSLIKFLEECGRVVKGKAARGKSSRRQVAAKAGTATVHHFPTVPGLAPAEVAESTDVPGRPGPKSGKLRRHGCLWCPSSDSRPSGCAVDYTSTTALLLHGIAKHGLGTTMTEVYGLVCPLCGEDCPDKLGMHTRFKHADITVTEAFKQAEADGDKYGVVESILKQADRV